MRAALHLAAALRPDIELVVGLALAPIAGERPAPVVHPHRAQQHAGVSLTRFPGELQLVLQAHGSDAGGQRQRPVLIGFHVVPIDELVGDRSGVVHPPAG